MRVPTKRFVQGLVLLALGQSALAQEPYEAHLRNLYVERRLMLEEHWAGADTEQQDRIQQALRASAGRSQPALYAASAQQLTELCVLFETGGADFAAIPLQRRVACSLDLLVLPGAFNAMQGERGDAMIVRVLPAYTRLFKRYLPKELHLSLYWIGPEGQELRARTESVHRDALVLPGFEMYIHAPASKPGEWHLVPVVEWERTAGRGVPVPVECVRAPFKRFDALSGSEARDPRGQDVLQRLSRILQHGVRDAFDPGVEELLQGAPEFLPPEPLFKGQSHTFIAGEKHAAPQHVILVVVPVLHEAEWSMAGAEALGWEALSRKLEGLVVLTDLPISSSQSEDALGLLQELGDLHPGIPRTLVLHGSGFGRLRLAAAKTKARLPFERLVVDTVLHGGPADLESAVDTLVISPMEAETTGLREVPQASGSSLYEARTLAPPVIAAAQIPDLLGSWMELLEDDAR